MNFNKNNASLKNDSREGISKDSSSWSLGRFGIILATLFFLVPLSCLPPTRFGYYNQTEFTLIVFWALCAFSGIWIFCLWKKNPRLAELTSRLPIVWVPFLLGITTVLISPFHVLPLRDFVGYSQMGEGAVTFIASGIMVSHFSILTRIPFYRKIIFISAFIVGLIISVLTAIGSMESPFPSWRYWSWAPFFFPDFLSYIDISLMVIYLYWRKDLKGLHLFKDSIAFLLFALITYHATNKSLNLGLMIASATILGMRFFPTHWWRSLVLATFFGLSIFVTLLVAFYDDISRALPDSLSFLGHITTLVSRTWLSKITFIDLWYTPLSWDWIQQLLIGKGWGSFSNVMTSNMFLIDQISLFYKQYYFANWEVVDRDLLHTHNILTTYWHSLGFVGVSLYLYTQYKIINSMSRNTYLLGAAFLISYQIQVLFWFQFIMTIPFSILAFSLLFKERSKAWGSFFFGQKWILVFVACLLLFSGLQSAITMGYEFNLKNYKPKSRSELVTKLISNPYIRLEELIGAQRQVRLVRVYATRMQEEFQESPETLVKESMRLVTYLRSLKQDGNYLANNLSLNILSELASKPETLKFLDAQTFKIWEELVKDHITLMPYRSDILLPFFNLYQTLGKEAIVLDCTKAILQQNPNDPIALWFKGSSLLRNSARFDEGLCILYHTLDKGIERFMYVPPPLRSKITQHARSCP